MWSLIGTAGTVALIGAGLLARSSYVYDIVKGWV